MYEKLVSVGKADSSVYSNKGDAHKKLSDFESAL